MRRKRGAGGPLPGVTFIAGDVFESVPEGADAYLFRHLLHDYDDDDCLKMLKNVRRAMKPDSRVLVLEKTVPTDDTPGPGRWLDLHVMLLTGGRERTDAGVSRRCSRRPACGSTRVLPTAHPAVEIIEVVAAGIMNAVEYCLLHGLKIAGPEHPALLSAGEMLSYGALARARQPVRGGPARGRRQARRPRRHADARHARHRRAASRRDGGGRASRSRCRAAPAPEELEQILAIVRPAVLVIDGEFAELAAAAIAAASPQTKLIRRDRELAAWKAEPAGAARPGAAHSRAIRHSG